MRRGNNPEHGTSTRRRLYLDGAGYEIHDGVRYDWKAGTWRSCITTACTSIQRQRQEPARALVIRPSDVLFMNMLFSNGRETRRRRRRPGQLRARDDEETTIIRRYHDHSLHTISSCFGDADAD